MTWLAHQMRVRPEATALRVGEQVLTYGALGELVGRAAACLAEAGVGPDSRVAVALPNSLEHVLAIYATSWLGAVLVPVDPRLPAVDPVELRRRLEVAGAGVLVASAGSAKEPVPCPVIDPAELCSTVESDPVASGNPVPPPRPRHPDELHSIVFTSGSTGRPEAVHLTHGNHLASAVASAFNLGIDRRDDWLCCLPLVHVGGLAIVLRSVLYGTALTLTDGFDAPRVAELFRSGRITLASLVPTMLRRLLALQERLTPGSAPEQTRGLRAILLGGGPADPALVEEAVVRRGLPVLATYGMTETASQVATVPPERLDAIRRGDEPPGSAGQPLLGAEIEIRAPGAEEGDAGVPGRAPATAGETGEIWVRGPMVSASSAGADGWFRTGDLGRLDAAGNLWVAGRRDQVIVTGGENVSPERVEAVLAAHPGVAECAVAGVDDPEWGRSVAAAVVPRHPERPPEPAALAAWCRERLAPFEVPKRWRLVADLPRTAAGKPRRADVAALFEGPPAEG